MFVVDGKEQSEHKRLKFHADLEHEGNVEFDMEHETPAPPSFRSWEDQMAYFVGIPARGPI